MLLRLYSRPHTPAHYHHFEFESSYNLNTHRFSFLSRVCYKQVKNARIEKKESSLELISDSISRVVLKVVTVVDLHDDRSCGSQSCPTCSEDR